MTASCDARHIDLYWVNQAATTPDQPGGTRHYDMARELVRRGAKVTLIASDLSLLRRTYSRRRGPWDLRSHVESITGVRLVWLSAGRYERNDWRRLLSMLVFGAGTFGYLLRRKRDAGTAIIGSSPYLFAAFAAWAAASLRRIPFMVEIRDLWPESYTAVTGKDRGGFVRLLRWMVDLLYRRARAIIVLAEGTADVIARRGVPLDKIHFIPNGVDLSRFPVHDRPATRSAGFSFVYTGAHGPANGLDVLVHACELLDAAGKKDIKVVLVGDGPAKDQLVAMARSSGVGNLEFRDPVPSDQVPEVLATMDAGLMLLAPAELFAYAVSPNKLFDYLAAGLPVVNNVPGMVADLVRQAGAGETCAPGDPQALATAMATMAEVVRSGSTRYGGGRQFVEQHYDRRVLAHELEQIVCEVVTSEAMARAGAARLMSGLGDEAVVGARF